MGAIKCAQCKAELPPIHNRQWGYKIGNSMFFCTYGCMRAKQESIEAKKRETWAKKQLEKEAKKKDQEEETKMNEQLIATKSGEDNGRNEAMMTKMAGEALAMEEEIAQLKSRLNTEEKVTEIQKRRIDKLEKRNAHLMGMIKMLIEMTEEEPELGV